MMKNRIYILVVLVLCLFLAGETLAAPKPPAKICFDLGASGGHATMALVIKSNGSMTMGDGATNYYVVNGTIFQTVQNGGPWVYPVSGTGYMQKGSAANTFHFSLAGSTFFGDTFYTIHSDGFWDVVANLATIVGKITGTKNNISADLEIGYVAAPISCGTVTIPVLY
jgi:hypothetical protein